MNITYFKTAYDTTVPYYVDISVAFDRIKTEKSKVLVDKVRAQKTKEEADKIKILLPAIVFAGEFTHRNNNSCKKQSMVIVIDIDNIKTKDKLLELKAKISKIKWVMACFISPRNNGLKIVVKLSTENHLGHYYKLEEYFKKEFDIDIDKACKDLSRVCFESCDKDIYVNMNSEQFTEVFVVSETVEQRVKIENSKPVTEYDKIYDYLKMWAVKKLTFMESQRHTFLLRLSAGCNSFGIPKSMAYDYMMYDYVEGATNFPKKEFEKIINHVYDKHSGSFNTKHFDQKTNYAYDMVTQKSVYESEVFDIEDAEEIGLTDFIYLDDIIDECLDNFINGTIKAETTHFYGLDDFYKLQKGEVTLLGGHGNHGKSTFLLNVLVNRAIINNERFAIFSPETYPPVYFYNDIISIYVGMSVESDFRGRCTLEQYKAAVEFVKDHFFYLFPKYESPTSKLIIKRFTEAVIKHKVDGVVIDPFNQMDREFSSNTRDDQYIGAVLSDFKKFATINNVYFWIIAHPNTKAGIKDKNTGEYPYPDVYEFAGGAIWNAKVDNILIYYRPEFNSNPESSRCQLLMRKIKRKNIGKRGMVEMDYVFPKRRFYVGGQNPLEKESSVPPANINDMENKQSEFEYSTEAPF